MYLLRVFKDKPVSGSKPGKKYLCSGQVRKNCGNVIWSPRISPGRSSADIARSWERAVLWLPGFCTEEFPSVICAGKDFMGQRRGSVCM